MVNRIEDTEDIVVIALVKGRESYTWSFKASRCNEAIRTTGRMASDPELSFTWYDAVVVASKMRKLT